MTNETTMVDDTVPTVGAAATDETLALDDPYVQPTLPELFQLDSDQFYDVEKISDLIKLSKKDGTLSEFMWFLLKNPHLSYMCTPGGWFSWLKYDQTNRGARSALLTKKQRTIENERNRRKQQYIKALDFLGVTDVTTPNTNQTQAKTAIAEIMAATEPTDLQTGGDRRLDRSVETILGLVGAAVEPETTDTGLVPVDATPCV